MNHKQSFALIYVFISLLFLSLALLVESVEYRNAYIIAFILISGISLIIAFRFYYDIYFDNQI